MATQTQQINWKPLYKHLSNNFVTKQELQDFREAIMDKISSLPTKEEFFSAMDKWMKTASTGDIEKPLHKLEHEKIRKFMTLNS